jgi:hypothetical protein
VTCYFPFSAGSACPLPTATTIACGIPPAISFVIKAETWHSFSQSFQWLSRRT